MATLDRAFGLWVVATVMACGSAKPAPEGRAVEPESHPPDARTLDAHPPDAPSPADAITAIPRDAPLASPLEPWSAADVARVCASSTYAALAAAGTCSAIDARCSFAEGECACAPRSYCGGIPPSDAVRSQLAVAVWQCTPKRTDGCPDQPPTGRCTSEGRTCTYGSCCIQPITCTAKHWKPGQASCPPAHR